MEQVKTCAKCRLSLPANDFWKRSDSSDGLGYVCKKCDLAKSACYYAKNKEKIKAQSAAYTKAHRDQHKVWSRSYNKRWRTANPEKYRATAKRWRMANPDKAAAATKRWLQANVDRNRAVRAAYRKATCERLDDAYVIHVLVQATSLRASQIPKSLIELKRAQLIIARKLKELKK